MGSWKDYTTGEALDADDLDQSLSHARTGVYSDFVRGEEINGEAKPVCAYLKSDDGKLYKTDATNFGEQTENFIGFIIDSGITESVAELQTEGIVNIPAIDLSETVAEYAFIALSSAYQANNIMTMNATTDWACFSFLASEQVGNVTKFDLWATKSTATDLTAYADIYLANDTDFKPTGASLGQSDAKTISTGAVHQFAWGTPVDLIPGKRYCVVITTTDANGTDFFYIRGTTAGNLGYNTSSLGDSGYDNHCFFSLNSGTDWTGKESCYFKIYSTKKVYQIGDSVFLSETAGEYTMNRPLTAGSITKKIGKLLSQTKIKLEPRVESYIGATKIAITPSIAGFVPIPPNCEKIVILYSYSQSGSYYIKGTLVINRNSRHTYSASQRDGSAQYNLDIAFDASLLFFSMTPVTNFGFWNTVVEFYT